MTPTTPTSPKTISPTNRNGKSNPELAVTFKNPLIFGRGFGKVSKNDTCIVFQLINEGILNFDGTINLERIESGVGGEGSVEYRKSLWLYIRYIWQHNHDTHDTFARMSKDSEANIDTPLAENFIKEVLDYMSPYTSHNDPTVEDAISITPITLAKFVNETLLAKKAEIKVPMISSLLDLMMQKLKSDTEKLNTEYGNQNTSEIRSHVNMKIPVTFSMKDGMNTNVNTAMNSMNYRPMASARLVHITNTNDDNDQQSHALKVKVKLGGGRSSQSVRGSVLRRKKLR